MFSLRPMPPTSWVRAGTITEIVGELSSGRTSLMTACLRDVTAAGGMAALVDADGAFDPASAARAGVVLAHLLWVRCGGRREAALAATDLLARCPGFALVALDAGETPPRVSLGGRSEEHTSELQSHLNLVCRLLLEQKQDPQQLTTPSTNTKTQTNNL